jgi:hypothetical protein
MELSGEGRIQTGLEGARGATGRHSGGVTGVRRHVAAAA